MSILDRLKPKLAGRTIRIPYSKEVLALPPKMEGSSYVQGQVENSILNVIKSGNILVDSKKRFVTHPKNLKESTKVTEAREEFRKDVARASDNITSLVTLLERDYPERATALETQYDTALRKIQTRIVMKVNSLTTGPALSTDRPAPDPKFLKNYTAEGDECPECGIGKLRLLSGGEDDPVRGEDENGPFIEYFYRCTNPNCKSIKEGARIAIKEY